MIARTLLLVGTLAAAGCAGLQQLAALRRVEFRLAGVDGARLAGIDLARVRSYADLTPADVARVAAAVASRELPLEMTARVEAENPRDNPVTARMTRLRWALLLQEKRTISGSIDQPVELPAGEPRVIPVNLRLDLLDFFDGTARSLVNLALSLAGADADPATVALEVVPSIDTPLGPISYPAPITIARAAVGR